MSLPPILQQLQESNYAGMGQIRQMMDMVRSAGNPSAMINQLAQNNPQLRNVMDMVRQSGGDPKAAFYALAQQKGVDPEQILNMLR